MSRRIGCCMEATIRLRLMVVLGLAHVMTNEMKTLWDDGESEMILSGNARRMLSSESAGFVTYPNRTESVLSLNIALKTLSTVLRTLDCYCVLSMYGGH